MFLEGVEDLTAGLDGRDDTWSAQHCLLWLVHELLVAQRRFRHDGWGCNVLLNSSSLGCFSAAWLNWSECTLRSTMPDS